MGSNVRRSLAAATGVMIRSLSCSGMPNNPVFEPIILFDARHLQIATLLGLPISACPISGKLRHANQLRGPACECFAGRTQSWLGREAAEPIETATEYGDLTSNCGALSGYVRKQRRAQKQEESNVSAGIALTACAKTRLKATRRA